MSWSPERVAVWAWPRRPGSPASAPPSTCSVARESRLTEAVETIRRDQPDADVLPEVCDISDLDAVRAYAADLAQRVPVLHAIVHNAGVMPPERVESAQGHESTLATHVIGPLAMTEALRSNLAAAESPRVVVVSSGGMYSAPLDSTIGDDMEYRRGRYEGIRAYARTKRIQVTMTELMAQRYAADGITVHSMHPGWADTPGISDSMPTFSKVLRPILRSGELGADTIVWLTAADGGHRLERPVLVRPAPPFDLLPAAPPGRSGSPPLGLDLRLRSRWHPPHPRLIGDAQTGSKLASSSSRAA